jgi:hypothetical protein
MITNKGKSIVSKFLLGQTGTFASHIAVGCGATPLLNGGTLGDYSGKTSLDFEMFRVPITSRGYVYEDGLDKLVLTAELPTSERYEITELGLFAGGFDQSVENNSKFIFTFSDNENWEYHTTSATKLTTISYPLTQSSPSGSPDPLGNMLVTTGAFFASADNDFFEITSRLTRQERPRYLNSTLMIAGNLAGTIYDSGGVNVPTAVSSTNPWTYTSGATHIHLTNLSLQDLDKSSSNDELRLAFSLVSKLTSPLSSTRNIRILIEFLSAHDSSVKAQFQYVGDINNTNRYIVASQTLGSMYRSNGFTWDAVNIAKIYVDVDDTPSQPTDLYYVALDGMRLENASSNNPLYGLTGYSIIRNTYTDSAYTQYAKPIIKIDNTSSLIEFRLSVGVA